jgi:hypothetical protein
VPAGLDNLILIGEEIKKRTFQLGSQGGGGVDTYETVIFCLITSQDFQKI